MVIEVLFGILFIIGAIEIVLRLQRAKGEQREQMKWLVYAIALLSIVVFGLSVLYYLPVRRELDPGALGWGTMFLGIPDDLALGVIPVAIFFAIFKYHLYEINLIINRTLVYVPSQPSWPVCMPPRLLCSRGSSLPPPAKNRTLRS
jgi:hypothetical protein